MFGVIGYLWAWFGSVSHGAVRDMVGQEMMLPIALAHGARLQPPPGHGTVEALLKSDILFQCRHSA